MARCCAKPTEETLHSGESAAARKILMRTRRLTNSRISGRLAASTCWQGLRRRTIAPAFSAKQKICIERWDNLHRRSRKASPQQTSGIKSLMQTPAVNAVADFRIGFAAVPERRSQVARTRDRSSARRLAFSVRDGTPGRAS